MHTTVDEDQCYVYCWLVTRAAEELTVLQLQGTPRRLSYMKKWLHCTEKKHTGWLLWQV